MLRCRVLLLDDTYIERELEKNAVGQVLFDKVCEYLNLLERDYFGLASWESSNTKVWLDVSKEVRKQVISQKATFTFNVKFYPPDPSLLAEDITRYLLCLQLRMDIMTGRLPCPSDTLAVLGSYTIQSEFGDYDPDLHGEDFLTNIPLAPDQTPELEEKVKELHCTHESMSPVQADKLFLQTARMLPLYGVHLHPAKDVNGTDVMLGVCADGLLVFEDGENTESFPWPTVLKMSYKRNNFHARIRHTEDSSESTIKYGLPKYHACKCLWKNAVEHHAFFRNHRPDKATGGLLHFGSRYRLRGLTYDEALEASADIKREPLRFSHSAIKRKAKDSMFVALKHPNRTEVDDWFQILASDQWPTYQETLDVEPDAPAKTEIDSTKYTYKEVMKESDLDEENTWFELLGGQSSSIQLPLPSVSDTLDSAVLNSWKQSGDDWFVLLEPRTLYSRFLPVETPLFGEGLEWEEVTTEENVKVVEIREEVQTLGKGHEELEFEPRPDIVRELDTEIKHQITQITEENLEEQGNGDKLQKVVVIQERTLEEEKYMGRPQEVSTEQQIRRVEIVKKTHEMVSEGSEIISEGTIEELQKRLLEVEAIEQNLQDIEMLNLGLQELKAWQRHVDLQGQQRGEIDDWYLLLDRKPVVVSSAPGELEEIEFQIPEQPVVEEVQIMEHEQKLEEEETRQVMESTQFKIREQSQKEVDVGRFALWDVPSKGTVPSRVVYDQEVTREETGPVMENVTSVKIYEEPLEKTGGMVETYSKAVQKIPVVRHETDDWFVLLEPISYETKMIPSVSVVEDYEDTVKVQEKKESIEEKALIIKEVQTKAREDGEVKMNIPVGTREVDDTWFLHFDPTPFEKRSVATDWLVPVPLTELYEETVGLRSQQRLRVKEKEVTTEEKHVMVREAQMKTGEVEKKNPVVRREGDDSWFEFFDQTPVEKRRVATAPVTEVYEDMAGLRTQRVTIKREDMIKDERCMILTERRAIAGEAEKKMPISRREVDDSWSVLFDPVPFEKRRVATAELLQEERAAWRKRKVEEKQIMRVRESVGLPDTLISRETRLEEVCERRLREEDRRKREVELRRPPRLPLLRAVERRREVEDDWHVLMEVQPKKSAELLQEDRAAWRKRKVEEKQIMCDRESVPIISPVDVHKYRHKPPVNQPLTSTPTAQPRITGPSYQDKNLTRLTGTQDVTQDISQESMMETESVILRKRREREIKGDQTIFVRHSIYSLEGFNETQEVVLRHHANISKLKRLFMEDIPICIPTEWEKRLSTHTPVIIPRLTNGDLVLA